MRLTFDDGRGSSTGRWLCVRFGPGYGYLRRSWTARNLGPGSATSPGHDCGHVGLKHCNSIYCSRWFCQLPSSRLGKLLLCGHTLKVWCGPTASPTDGILAWLEAARANVRILRRRRRAVNDNFYSLISFR